MGLFPTDADDGDEVTNALGTIYKYDIADDKWYIKGISESDLAHNSLGGLNDGDVYEHISQAQKNALHAIVVAGDLLHNSLDGLDADDIKHITAAQLGNLHAVLTNLTQLATRNHNDLQNIQGGADLQHLSAAQVGALHAKQHAMDNATYHTRTDIATLNADINKHGFLKKLDNVATNYMDGEGNWTVPAGAGGGSDKGTLQGNIHPIAGCTWGSSYIAMSDLNDSCCCQFNISENVSASHDLKLVLVYSARNLYTAATMNFYMSCIKTNDTETFSWNLYNAVANTMTKPDVDWELKTLEWIIPHANFDKDDAINIYWVNTNAYDYRVHGMFIEYTEG